MVGAGAGGGGIRVNDFRVLNSKNLSVADWISPFLQGGGKDNFLFTRNTFSSCSLHTGAREGDVKGPANGSFALFGFRVSDTTYWMCQWNVIYFAS